MNNEYPENDNEFQEYVLEKVKNHKNEDGSNAGWTLTFDGSLCFGCPADSPIVPEVGMTTRQYGKGFGSIVRGLFINGQKVFYRTEEEERQKHLEWCQREDTRKKEEYLAKEEEYNRKIAAFPECYQRRIQKFRNANPNFNWKYLGYEMFCCEQSLMLADLCKTTEKLEEFYKLPWEEQLKLIPEDQKEAFGGHSGNTFGSACRLAQHYLTNQENVVLEHGALVYLVGCEEYGCLHEGK